MFRRQNPHPATNIVDKPRGHLGDFIPLLSHFATAWPSLMDPPAPPPNSKSLLPSSALKRSSVWVKFSNDKWFQFREIVTSVRTRVGIPGLREKLGVVAQD